MIPRSPVSQRWGLGDCCSNILPGSRSVCRSTSNPCVYPFQVQIRFLLLFVDLVLCVNNLSCMVGSDFCGLDSNVII